MSSYKTPTLIVGAGPAGLAVAGRMRTKGLPFEIIEKESNIAHSWHNHYDRLCLHTVKQLSNLPHLPFPEDYPRYVPREKLVAYYEQYARHFTIKPYFKAGAKHIRRLDKGKWEVECENGMHFETNRVVLCTGVNRDPYVPTWPGQETFQGDITHSRIYKNPAPFLGRKVLVVGFGNTGAEVALDLAESHVPSWIVIRNPVNIVPRDLNGRPTQVTAKMLAKLPFGLGDWLGTQIRKIYYGDLTKYGIKPSKMHPAVQLRETGKTPVIDLGTIDKIKKGIIQVVPGIERFSEKGVHFEDGRFIEFDKVILCTGYKARMDDFLENTDGLLDRFDVPKEPIGSGIHEGLYFVGFDNYKLGGILGTIFTDSELVANHIEQISQTVPSN